MKNTLLPFVCIAFAGLFLGGCMTVQYTADDLAKAENMSLVDLAHDYYLVRTGVDGRIKASGKSGFVRSAPQTQAELERILLDRGLSTEDLNNAKGNDIAVGMSRPGLYAAWGAPDELRSLINEFGNVQQHIYGHRISGRIYVYTRDDTVVAWSD